MTSQPYQVIDCGEVQSLVGATPAASPRAWHTRWDRSPTAATALKRLRRADFEFHTSGSTGTPVVWWHPGSHLCANADVLLDAVGRDFDAVVSFAPPRHIYGACATVALPAVLGAPVWFWSGIECEPPPIAGASVLVSAIPWTFTLLHRQLEWLLSQGQVTILHSTALLPAEALALREDVLGSSGVPRPLDVVEVLGSTETGAIAYHTGWDSATPWTLFSGVTMERGAGSGPEVPLRVVTPWRARAADGSVARHWETGDLVEIIDESRFVLRGRIGRLVKINGRRVDLLQVEEQLRSTVACSDVACVLIQDELRGESFDVLIAGVHGEAEQSVRAALSGLGLGACRIATVEGIQRSETGKVLARQSQCGLEA